jgi:hypothetical protein
MRSSRVITAVFTMASVLLPIRELSVCAAGGCDNRTASDQESHARDGET